MNNFFKKLTIFFVLGILAILTAVVFSIMLITGNSASDGLMGIYFLLAIVPVIVFLVIERFLVRSYGSQKVNKAELYFLLFIVFLWLLREVLNWLS